MNNFQISAEISAESLPKSHEMWTRILEAQAATLEAERVKEAARKAQKELAVRTKLASALTDMLRNNSTSSFPRCDSCEEADAFVALATSLGYKAASRLVEGCDRDSDYYNITIQAVAAPQPAGISNTEPWGGTFGSDLPRYRR